MCSSDLFRGLNFLLSEQHDRAIDAFIEVVKLDPETIDLHFALGSLFRRRGETERAIRVHQNLLSRPDLPIEQQVHAQYELGMDYLKAGLLDRAEETFNLLVDTQYGVQARRALLEIFQREKEWRRAIAAAEGLQESGAGAMNREIAQFYCELAQDALVQGNLDVARRMLEAAASGGHVGAMTDLGDLLIEAGPDSFLSQKPWGLELCARLGLSDRLINTDERNKKTFVYSRGKLRELPQGLVVIVPTKLGPFLKSGLVSWPGIARMGLDVLLPARRSEEDESLAQFFSRRLGREAFEQVVEPLMAGIYAGDAAQISIKATFPRFLELERKHGSLIRGMLAARPPGAAPPTRKNTSCSTVGSARWRRARRWC
mgnify:CR=1 FL=1